MTKSRGIRTPKGVALDYFYANLDKVTSGCKLWPYNVDKDGYGYVWLTGARTYSRVTVLACVHAHGSMPQPGMVAAHGICHNPLCWSGSHLSWKTHKQNAADRRRDGTKDDGEANPCAKLNNAMVREIRLRYAAGGISYPKLAADYGVAPITIERVIHRVRWKHIP